MLELWGDIGFLVFAGSTTIFTLLYLILSRWYKTLLGTLIAVFMVGVTVLCAYLSLRVWDVDLPAVEYVRLTVFWVLGLAMTTSVYAFLEIQLGNRLRGRLSCRYADVGNNRIQREDVTSDGDSKEKDIN